MDTEPQPFEPDAPIPLDTPLGRAALVRAVYRNPLEIWGRRAYTEPVIEASGFGFPTIVINDPDLIRAALVEHAGDLVMAPLRQRVLRPILRDGLLTAEGEVWKRTRKAMAPMFTPRHIDGLCQAMDRETAAFAETYRGKATSDVSADMTLLTYNVLAATLFSDEIAGDRSRFEARVNRLLDTMGRLDPMDLLGMPDWIPRLTHLRGRKPLAYFREAVRETMAMRRAKLDNPKIADPEDLLTLLMRMEGPDGLTRGEVEDNIITFIGAGHETTARALGWTLYCLAEAPQDRILVEEEIDRVMASGIDPALWLEAMPKTRAAFEEAMRLFPPAASLNRAAARDIRIGDLAIAKGTTILVLPWLVHRHEALWERPRAFRPQRFWPGNRERLHRFQYLPFGAGPRICIGQQFAMQEGVIALANLMKRFRFDTYRQKRPWPVQKLTVQPDGGLPMRITAR